MAGTNKTDGAGAPEMLTVLVGSQAFCIDAMSERHIRVWAPATPLAHAPDLEALTDNPLAPRRGGLLA